MLGLCFTVRPRDKFHAWDVDPERHAKNLAFEDRLESVVPQYAPQQNPEPEMPQLLTAILKFGVLPGLAVWLIFMGVTEYRVVGAKSLAILEQHAQESTRQMESIDRNQERIVNLLRASCVNEAKNAQERNDCLRAGQ